MATINDMFPPGTPKRCNFLYRMSSGTVETTSYNDRCDRDLDRLIQEFNQLETASRSLSSVLFEKEERRTISSQTISCSPLTGKCTIDLEKTTTVDDSSVSFSAEVTLTKL